MPMLVRDWSPKMDGIDATIWAGRATRKPVDDRSTTTALLHM
jgi:hypothetical protein